jgi:predicted helicase
LQNDPLYKHELVDVWLWKKWPDRWKEEEVGIDLVAEHRSGTLWAVPAKAYGEDTTVTMHDMARFLVESGRKSPGAFAPG